jgi:glycosyltransferase involved in cell wall biosynthesis
MAGVLVVSDRALPARGGLAVATSRIARQAAARGENVHLLFLSRDAAPGMRGRNEEAGVMLHPLGVLPSDERNKAALTDHAQDLVRAHGLDVVHGMYATQGGYAGVLAAQMSRVASVVSIRGNDLDRGLYRERDLSFLSHAVRAASVVTAVSREASARASAVFAREVIHVTNSVDAQRFRPERPDNSLRAVLGLGSEPVIGFSGELREKKGMRFLLPAFAHLAAEMPLSLLLIGGVRSDARDALETFKAKAPEAAAKVRVVEYARDADRLARLLALCDLLVFPSLVEGTPNAVLEAMAAARPILATAVGGHTDLIEHGRTGALLSLDALDRLPEAMRELLEMPREEREALGQAARAHVVAHHDPAQESLAYAQVYERARSA